MNVVALLLAVVGIPFAWWVGRHFSQRPELVIELDVNALPFEDIQPKVREELESRGRVGSLDLTRYVEFTVRNEGNAAIRECVRPLSITLHEQTSVDAAIIATSPGLGASLHGGQPRLGVGVELDTTMSLEENTWIFPFDLMNPGDWFRVKMLLVEGFAERKLWTNPEEWTFSIRCPDLPATIPMTSAAQAEASPARVTLAIIVAGIVALAGAFGVLRLFGLRIVS